MSKYRKYYRTADGCADYLFSFEEQSGGDWRIYIESQPSYSGRSKDSHSTHRVSDWGRKYICWSKPIDSLDEAMQVAAYWANKTQEYIRTGQRF